MNFDSLQLYQVIILIIAGVMIYQGCQNFFKKHTGQTVIKLLVRILVWGGMATIVIFPTITNTLASIIGISGNINAAILTGFIFVFVMIFKLLSTIERLEQQITVVTRENAMKEVVQNK